MKRRTCITAAAAAFALPSAVCAQTSRTWRVCSAHTSAAAGTRSFEEAFLDALRELGFERSRNLEYSARYADGDPARLPGVVDEVLALKPDLVFCIEAVARVMRSKTTTPQGGESGRAADRTADALRAGVEPEGRPGDRRHVPADGAAACGTSH